MRAEKISNGLKFAYTTFWGYRGKTFRCWSPKECAASARPRAHKNDDIISRLAHDRPATNPSPRCANILKTARLANEVNYSWKSRPSGGTVCVCFLECVLLSVHLRNVKRESVKADARRGDDVWRPHRRRKRVVEEKCYLLSFASNNHLHHHQPHQPRNRLTRTSSITD